ncbi:hypothetical protein TDB9533_03264 [Thalassocella blandensis]|nr:hypothetical protein TDB9533_03264 [Thalassocella blandensis]
MNEHDIAFVASFCGERAQGNRHIVINVSEKHDMNGLTQTALTLSGRLPQWILVLLRVPESVNASAQARFFKNDHIIQRCGSGSVAAAAYLDHRLQDKTLYHHRLLQHVLFPLTLQTSSTPIVVGKQKSAYYYETPVLPLVNSRLPQLQRKLINQPVTDLFLLGGKQDYCVLVLRHKRALERCELNTRLYQQISRRSVIVTAPSQTPGVDYYLRYFNPRYGAYEDAATGSANAMLADYWQRALRKTSVRGRQLSPEGGEFIVSCQKGNQIGLSLHQQVIGQARFILPDEIGHANFREVSATVQGAFTA